MAMQLSQLKDYLFSMGLRFTMRDNDIQTSFETKKFINPDLEQNITIVISLDENGEYLRMVAQNLYRFPADMTEARAVFNAIMSVSWNDNFVSYNYDDLVGEVQAKMGFPLEDGMLTKLQFQRAINDMVQTIDDNAPFIMGSTVELMNYQLTMLNSKDSQEPGQDFDSFYQKAGVAKPNSPPHRSNLRLEE
ncbi:MAG TPA: hypothetical protein PLC54_06175 [Spirochaetales bacterium]|nr:hypothetical protein [Spirochaetales bacterium]